LEKHGLVQVLQFTESTEAINMWRRQKHKSIAKSVKSECDQNTVNPLKPLSHIRVVQKIPTRQNCNFSTTMGDFYIYISSFL